jgi:hypothetical protein
MNNSKDKMLLCYSYSYQNKSECTYGNKCSYAHSLSDQTISDNRVLLYKIILDRSICDYNLNNVQDINLLCELCNGCRNGICFGGFNCKHGVCDRTFKICRNDLNGECLNPVHDIEINHGLISKMKMNLSLCQKYIGCINGHHLSYRNIRYRKPEPEKRIIKGIRFIKPFLVDEDVINNLNIDENDIEYKQLENDMGYLMMVDE